MKDYLTLCFVIFIQVLLISVAFTLIGCLVIGFIQLLKYPYYMYILKILLIDIIIAIVIGGIIKIIDNVQ